ncbi:hypothetical protein K1T71_008326 [Dendrolimus kikuchii]|uniref:Uncharacterized protein n=1 Tax=Dendrolimus kikuchii TaxID=765133 RepID=A0ACC1CYE8_9NEOP|nr:hypothetical protein K1T71_008326 [Dendrolimus kikuchii]
MAWSMPPPGPWNPAMTMTPDMGMGSYSAEQWTVLQQQNWQQWAQWQQQYAQWQNQYGEKYAEQIQTIQAMGGMPPLPPANTAPPPAPPPPDKPPPPPHENNQPLYAQTSKPPPPAAPAPGPVPVPTTNQWNKSNQWNNTNQSNQNTTSNNQNWSYNKAPSKVAPQPLLNTQPPMSTKPPVNSQPSGNAEALKKLAEEERLFDIQFKQWEQEIEKWRRENENHPDKQAYKEYEQKFEACRLQLMERRRQMKLKRDRLMHNTPQPSTTSIPGNIAAAPGSNININKPQQDMPTPNFSQTQHNYSDKSNISQFQQQQQKHNMPQSYNRSNNKNIDPQDRYESYQDMNQQTNSEHSYEANDNSSFLPTTDSNKGIPGLDLVPDVDKNSNKTHEVVDITDDNHEIALHQENQQSKGPDYSTISKGINSILGDEKIMNILSMVNNHTQSPPTNNLNLNMSRPYPGNNQQDNVQPQDNRNQHYCNNQHFDNRQQSVPQSRQEHMLPNRQQNMPQNRQQNMPQNRQQNMPQNRQQIMPQNRQQNMPQNRQQNMVQNRQRPGFINQQNQDTSYPPPLMEQNISIPEQEQHYDSNDSYDQSNMQQQYEDVPHRGGLLPLMRTNISSGRPLLERITQHNADYPRALPERPPIEEVVPPVQPPRPKWVEEPMFTPSFIVEYEHKPLRLKARDFIDPVHMFDYNHKSKDSDVKKRDFEKEIDDLFPSMRRRPERFERDIENDRYREPVSRESHYRDREPKFYDRRLPRDDFRDEYRLSRDELRDEFRPKLAPRDDDYDMRRVDDRFDDRRRDDRDKFTRRDDLRDRSRERDRERERDRYRERERDKGPPHIHVFRERDRERDRDRFDRIRDLRDERRSGSRDRDSRKRGHSKDSEISIVSKKSKDNTEKPAVEVESKESKHIVMIDDILELPGREMRPEKIVIILRGPPGSGKSYLAKLIRDREAEHGGTARIMSIDDYFMQESEVEEKDPATGKIVKKQTLKYEYDEESESTYLTSLSRAFKRSISDGYFSFLIFDAVNDQLKNYADIWNYSRQNGFQVYICTMDLDPQTCYRRNIHNRKLDDIEVICSRFFPTPLHHIQLDATTLLQNAAIQDVQMEDVQDNDFTMEDAEEPEVESSFTSKWEKMEDAAQLARLDGTSKPLRSSQLSMEDYLQLDDWKPNTAKPGKKTVRWADIEERRKQEKMRAIGFVVGQTDWNRMTDPTMGSSALTQTKYIERVRR